ncbi:MAG: peptidyl-prolyl cis-trans isomerase [Candidatus Hydrogenedentes bacterium]|nr:peptidyl-prolyl cis-trans isomerase [Candidatus Hydrogenedentota bacterium]
MIRAATVLAAFGVCIAFAQAPDLSKMDIVLQSVPDGPVAVVNGHPIDARVFKDVYMRDLLGWAQLNSREVPDEERLGIAINSLRMLVEREVLYQEAVKRNLTVSDAELQKVWAEQIADLKKRVTKPGESELTEAQVLEKANTSREEALKELRYAMMVDLVRDAIIKENGVTVSDAEVTEWFGKNKDMTKRPDMLRLSQIYFRRDTSREDIKKEAAKQKATDAYNKIKSGQSFEGVARAVSEGQYKDKGGEWPVLPTTDFPDFVQQAVATMKPGDVSAPIESKEGWHILKLLEAIPGQEGNLETSKDRIQKMLLAQKGARAINEFCSTITSDSGKVRVYLDLESQLRLRPDLIQKLGKGEAAANGARNGTAPKAPASPKK